MKTEIKCVPKEQRLVCSGRECSSYQRVEGHQIWKCVANHGMTSTSRQPGSICHPGERQRVAQLVAENVSLRKANAQLRRVETRTKVLRERAASLTDEIKWAKEAAFNAVPGRPESGTMMQDTLLAQITVLVRAFEARVDRWSVRAGSAELERDRLLAEIARLQEMRAGPTGLNDFPLGKCGVTGEVGNPASTRAVGCREVDICDEVKCLREEAEKSQATFRALSGPILPELLVGIATGRVSLALQAQITVAPRPEPTDDAPARVDRVEGVLLDRFFRMERAYGRGGGDKDEFNRVRHEAALAIVAALFAAPEANTCAPPEVP